MQPYLNAAPPIALAAAAGRFSFASCSRPSGWRRKAVQLAALGKPVAQYREEATVQAAHMHSATADSCASSAGEGHGKGVAHRPMAYTNEAPASTVHRVCNPWLLRSWRAMAQMSNSWTYYLDFWHIHTGMLCNNGCLPWTWKSSSASLSLIRNIRLYIKHIITQLFLCNHISLPSLWRVTKL